MCGIVGYIGEKACIDFLFNSLKKLEYRGYDSAGISVLKSGEIYNSKEEGKLKNLEKKLHELPKEAKMGIGHTRWATHGKPSYVNAHPHVDAGVSIVHNGIIENHDELKAELIAEGYKFISDTDTEVVLHCLIRELKQGSNTRQTIVNVVSKLQGAFSLAVMFADFPDKLFLVKLGSPLIIGLNNNENFFASDVMAIAKYSEDFCFLNDFEIAELSTNKVSIFDFAGNELELDTTRVELSNANTEKQGFKHYMLKEIHEQPRVIADMIKSNIDIHAEKFNFTSCNFDNIDLKNVSMINIVACGSAFFTCLYAKYIIESFAKITVNVELGSEFRYRKPCFDENSLFIAVSQSGETADTLASLKYAKENGIKILSICNSKMSSIARASDALFYMNAGPEIGVASTKAVTSMMLCHYFLALACAQAKNTMSAEEFKKSIDNLNKLPPYLDQVIDYGSKIDSIANSYYESKSMLFLGRGIHYSVALEGALKLKEISYIHAEGYAGGELKHGAIALIDRHMPTVAVCPQDEHYEKMLANIAEVKARDGKMIIFGASGDKKLQKLADHYLEYPQIDDPALQAILSVIPLQLLSYSVACKRGTDVDQPRNLAKSVTVE